MYKKCTNIKSDIYCKNTESVLNISSLRSPSSIDSLLISERTCLDGSKSVKFNKDIYFLFNQHRLDRMSLQAFTNYLDSMPQSTNSGLSNLRSKVSDADLHKFVKSRYIQSQSELLAWSSYITSQYANAQQEVKDYLAQQQVDVDTNKNEPQTE